MRTKRMHFARLVPAFRWHSLFPPAKAPLLNELDALGEDRPLPHGADAVTLVRTTEDPSPELAAGVSTRAGLPTQLGEQAMGAPGAKAQGREG